MTTQLRKAGANWVDGDRFFDREAELQDLRERVRDGTHTLLTAQRRMGKTSLVRELLRQLDDEGDFATIFVDLEAANDPADAVAEIAIQARAGSRRLDPNSVRVCQPTAGCPRSHRRIRTS